MCLLFLCVVVIATGSRPQIQKNTTAIEPDVDEEFGADDYDFDLYDFNNDCLEDD